VTTSRILLRAAELDDLDGITELHTQARTAYYQAGGYSDAELTSREGRSGRREMWRRALLNDTKTVLCGLRGDELVGILAMGPPLEADVDAAAVGQLYQIHVRPGQWGQGIGSLLHGAFVRRLRDTSLTAGVLEAWERNSRAQAFYARHGWRPDGQRRPGPAGGSYLRMRLEPTSPG
jgi:RimJ/RimL family protein N-acetyltransferase